jgi:hypothetical protein
LAPHQLDHTFIGPRAALDALAAELPEEFGLPRRHDGSMTVSNASPLDDQDEIDGMTMFLRDLAQAHGVAYDGWGAAVVRGN